ncbi:MAG TPA: DNA repair protein RecN [Anaerolineaceae bacterium]|nr:MAG: DNA repair protein RecN [Anaerolineaceae bacterium 46_22]HAF49250.1 DNA repair protein RecN [Anaerolineaceae bacterium]
MLTELRIENFAIIHELQLNFMDGLVVFTGETGAGKSIILDALEAVLGGRAETAAIRTGAARAQIEASFRLEQGVKSAVNDLLEREALLDDPDYVTLSREIQHEGRNTARINGRIVTAAIQREVGAYLVDIHGQSEHLSLLQVRNHLELLDNFANIQDLLLDYRGSYEALRQVRKELTKLRQSEQDAARRVDMLSFQIQEIDAAKLKPGDEEELRLERTRLANAESLAQHSQNALMMIEDGTPEVPAISELLGEVVEALRSLSKIDPSAEGYYERSENSLAGLQELALDLQNYGENIEFNPRLLNRVEERIDLVNNLKRKYGNSIEEILAFGQHAREELDSITHAEERIEHLAQEETELLKMLAGKAIVLSEKRQEAAKVLSRLVEVELEDLRMANARFEVSMETRSDESGLPLANGQRVAFDASGFDRVAFLVETNPGEGLKSLVKVASGGETSRLMLALKNVLAKADKVPTLIFDEIDQGIGGRVGMVVGEKLWNLSRQHQVMCITHLPQLAAFGDQHYKVTKEMVDGRTLTRALLLEGGERQNELAQMLGPVSEGTLQSANEILAMVENQKNYDTD